MRRFNNNRPYRFFLGWLHEFMGLIHAVSAHFLLHKCKLLGSKIRTAQKPNEQRLSDAAAALGKGRGGAWRQINPVELNRRSVGV